ncbi:hypothetical protein IAQ61_004792 [Plenodomus lingam]|uniref:uncharacterized protein n=1 Tax=Leptosphaeria maculans TaxID=5022 RepID=UPI00332ADBC5|nr:hypothetical protein IAQ61_004792 [Plenodomus lingam]
MSHLQYFSYKGVGERNLRGHGYQQAVRVGDRIEASGQGNMSIEPLLCRDDKYSFVSTGGWHPETGAYSDSVKDQIEQAFANVDLCLKDAGGKGWSQVYRVNSYHPILDDDVLKIMADNFKKWMPDHSPIWTCVGVMKLAEDKMKVEIEVVAHDPK